MAEDYDFGTARGAWPAAIHTALTARGVRLLAHVPDGGNAPLIARCEADPAITVVPLTTEEEGVGVISGAWLGGMRSVLAIQSSGVGNCGNLFAMLRSCTMPALLIVSMRGDGPADGGHHPGEQASAGNAAPDLPRRRYAIRAGEQCRTATRRFPGVEEAPGHGGVRHHRQFGERATGDRQAHVLIPGARRADPWA
ncbi:hypothetical protein [Neoroseomonas lacus]|uniref:Thiamine pyrophosphate enzyme N-terminal TPP-binding domain-containing protein n=1 Tax=Neoroseomonas lacus TaxID=287609 RepID=A0A917NKI0_9PROT|nr:hypothetical protein [Neoroseomonas lacus]GGJ04622.1 hypothetical protein GCM10011320_09400 [Neoroseomonas lacus]